MAADHQSGGVDNPDLLAKARGAGPTGSIGRDHPGKSHTYVPNEHYYDKSRIKWEKVVISSSRQNAGSGDEVQLKLLSSDPFRQRQRREPAEGSADCLRRGGLDRLIMNDRDGEVQPYLKDVRVRGRSTMR